MSSWGLLDAEEEIDLHKSRLLNVEEKPLKRVTKRLTTLHSLTTSRLRQAPTPPPERQSNISSKNGAPSNVANGHADPSYAVSDLSQLKEELTLDFAAFESSIARLQLLLAANASERDRYAAERERILSASQAVRDDTDRLRAQLDAARATLDQRKGFDELADRITANPALRPHAEQAAGLRKLEEEIAELEAESRAYGTTWRERRDQFSRIMDESMRLRRLIRDEKEEVERREGMGEEDGDANGTGGGGAEVANGNGGGAGSGGGSGAERGTPKPGVVSGNATPRPEGGPAGRGAGGGGAGGAEGGEPSDTPQPASTAGDRTPARDSPGFGHEGNMLLKLRPGNVGSLSRSGSRAASREATPDTREKGDENGERDVGEGADVEMSEVKETNDEQDEEIERPSTPVLGSDTPHVTVELDAPNEGDDAMDTT